MSSSENEGIVLDTLCLKKKQIFLKPYHAQRTFEALALQGSKITLQPILEHYDQLEKEYANQVTEDQIMRLLVSEKDNRLCCQIEILTKSFFPPCPRLQILNSPQVPAGLGKQNFKWNHRQFWKKAIQSKNPEADDLIFINTENEITETSRCNLFFFDSKKNVVYTPPLTSGCINGVYRRYVMTQGQIKLPNHGEKNVEEKSIYAEDLNLFVIYIANSIRGVLPAQLLAYEAIE